MQRTRAAETRRNRAARRTMCWASASDLGSTSAKRRIWSSRRSYGRTAAWPTVPGVSLRGRTVDQSATLPDGRHVTVHVGVPEDPYIPRGELETVDVELRVGGRVLAAVNTVLDPDQESEALELARAIVNGLESGELEPTASAIEPLAETLR